MKKVLDFLEQYVQWIALALGGLFLAYTIYTYALQTPVTVSGIASVPLNPGDVDTTIENGPAKQLQLAMTDQRVPVMTVPHMVQSFTTELSEANYSPARLPDIFDCTTVANPVFFNGSQKFAAPTAVAITELPKIPVATVLDHSSGKSNVQLAAAPANNGAPPAGVLPVVGAADKAWVTVRYSISPKQIADSFAKANIPAWTERTEMLQVILQREEILPDGQMSEPKDIAPLNEAVLLPFPDNNTPNLPQAQQDYLKWAPDHIIDIMQPAFLTVNKGDAWVLPGQAAAAAAPVVLPPLDPTKDYPANVLNQYPEADKLAYNRARAAARQQQQQQRNRRPSGGSPSGPPGGQGQGQGPDNSILDPDRAKNDQSFFAPSAQYPGQQPPPGLFPPQGRGSVQGSDQGGDQGGQMPPPGMQPGVNPPGGNGDPSSTAVAAAAAVLPHAAFDPNQFQADLIGWAHDLTVEPGHSYQYRIIYKLQNPIFHTNASKDAALIGQFALVSEASAWTAPISIATSTNFFLASNSREGATSARFKVFKWENGVERMKEFEVAPGDIIGNKDATGDYTTGATVVALRFDDPKNPGSMTVLVMDGSGRLEQRDYRSDQAKPELNPLTTQVTQAQAAAATATPVPGS